jgi:hypothetical protein
MEVKLNDLRIFINTLCYNNVDNFDFFKVEKCSSIEDALGIIFIKLFETNKM